MSINPTKLGRTIVYALRHHPRRYGLTLDAEGWVPLDDLLKALHSKGERWESVSAQDILDMLANMSKPRLEVRDGKIRARYGHSTPEKIQYTPAEPPDVLYHGTASDSVDAILKDGLKPMRRQYVHLSAEQDTARAVGSRHGDVVILKIDAKAAHRAGIAFYYSADSTWLADSIPPGYIDTV